MAGIALSRVYGRPYAERVVDAGLLARWDTAVADRGVPVILVLFLLPGLPDDAICFLCGLTTIDTRRLVALAVVGRSPSFLLVSYAGERLYDARFLEATVVLFVFAVLSVAGYVYRDTIVARLGSP